MAEDGNDRENLEAEIEKLEKEIKELKGNWPVHSVRPQMAQRLEDLEDELARKKRHFKKSKGQCPGYLYSSPPSLMHFVF